jgi:Tfp pilus assembly protein PilP
MMRLLLLATLGATLGGVAVLAQAPAQPSPAASAGQAKPAPATPVQPTPAPGAAPSTPGTPVAATPAPAEPESPGFTYNPEGRRDPFVSLLRRGGAGLGPTVGGVRPAGLAGLETAEVTLKGTIQSQGGYVGILQGADNKTYIVRAGDRLLDGTVRSITPNVLVILQQVNDPLSLEKQREVRKVLRQTDEAK